MPPKRETYTRQRNATVSALGCGRKFSDVVVNKLATRRLHNPSAVGGSIVRVTLAECDTLGHCGCYRDIEHSQHDALTLTQPSPRSRSPSLDLSSLPTVLHTTMLNCTPSHTVPLAILLVPRPNIISTHFVTGGERCTYVQRVSISFTDFQRINGHTYLDLELAEARADVSAQCGRRQR